MNNKPLVSVIMPVYNHEKYVKQAIESIVKQSYKNFELFVIDDGSSDNTPLIIEELSKKYGFYFETQENQGVPSTLNKLFAMCKGKYIAGCASDDYWTLDKLEIQVNFMEDSPDTAICFGNVLLINQNGEILPNYSQIFSAFKLYKFKDIFAAKHNLPALTAMWRKSAYDQIGHWDERFLFEDLNMWLKVTHYGFKVVVLKDLLGYYRKHETNMSHDLKNLNKERVKLLKQYRSEKGYFKSLVKTYQHYYLHSLLNIFPKQISSIIKKSLNKLIN